MNEHKNSCIGKKPSEPELLNGGMLRGFVALARRNYFEKRFARKRHEHRSGSVHSSRIGKHINAEPERE